MIGELNPSWVYFVTKSDKSQHLDAGERQTYRVEPKIISPRVLLMGGIVDAWPELLATERRLMACVNANPGITQKELGERLDVPQQTVSRQINDLLARGLLAGGERVSQGRRGQPSLTLTINPERIFSLGVSIMADAVSVMLVDLGGSERGYRRYRPSTMSRAAVLEQVEIGLAELTAAAGLDPAQVLGIGIGITGFFRADRRSFNTPLMLDEWALVDVAAIFSGHFGRPAWADNDGNVAAVGESLVGVGRWAPTFAYLYIATGFGGGAIVDGAMLAGRHGNAGEYATMLPPQLYPSPTLELLRQTMALRGVEFADVSALLEGFDIDLPGVDEWIAKVTDSLSLVCGACVGVLDPDAIVLGGRIPTALAERLIPLVTVPIVPRRGEGREAVPIVAAAAPGDATALGAAVLPLQIRIFGGAPAR
jgi:predicted NBD/HSP70 family sugar kinase